MGRLGAVENSIAPVAHAATEIFFSVLWMDGMLLMTELARCAGYCENCTYARMDIVEGPVCDRYNVRLAPWYNGYLIKCARCAALEEASNEC